MKNIFLFFTMSLALVGCVSSSKDIYFRSRLPTMEAPTFNENNRFGLELDLESDRFTTQITRNLVSDFHFYNDNASFHNAYGGAGIEGKDFSVTAAHWFSKYPMQLGISADFAEIKFGLYGFQTPQPVGFFAMVDAGVYKTATYTENGGCSWICLSSQKDKDEALRKEGSILADHGGNEKKYGLQLGYYFNTQQAAYIGYHRMDYYYRASARQELPPNGSLSFQESFSGYGIGLGYYHEWSSSLASTFSFEDIKIQWATEDKRQLLYALKLIYKNL